MGFLSHLLIEQHEVFLMQGQSLDVDQNYDSLSACLFGHRIDGNQGATHFRKLREYLEPLIEPESMSELDRAFCCISEAYCA